MADKRARAARFAREARNPPPMPKKQMAWAGGKIETSSREEALLKLLARKTKAGVALTEDQRRAMVDLQALQGSSQGVASTGGKSVLGARSGSSANNLQQQPRAKAASVKVQAAVELTVAASAARSSTVATGAARSEVRKLEKKVRECEELERRVAQGEVLEANLRAKMHRKAEWQQLALAA